MRNEKNVAKSVIRIFQPVNIVPHGEEEINVEASHKSLW